MTIDWSSPVIVGILNLTPDSFSDGGKFCDPSKAVTQAELLVQGGASVVDVGGESTRPGSTAVTIEEEISRTTQVVESLSRRGIVVSIDTTKSEVAKAALAAGAEIVNDISGGKFDCNMWNVASQAKLYIAGHVRADSFETIHTEKNQVDATATKSDLVNLIAKMPSILRKKTVVDPCLGFGKNVKDNIALVDRSLEVVNACNAPVLIGASRKRFVRALFPWADNEALVDFASALVSKRSIDAGAHMVRVHSPHTTRMALEFNAAWAKEAQQ